MTEPIDIKIKLVHPNAKLPVKATEEAACFDVFAAEITKVSHSHYLVNLGFATEIPKGYKGVIVPRSSITKFFYEKLSIKNSPGQIDSDYRGEWKIVFECDEYLSFPYKVGDRVAQIFFEKVIPVEWNTVDSLSDTKRGGGGFGHTGK